MRGGVLPKKPTLADTEQLVKYLSEHRVAEFDGHGLKLKFYQEMPELKMPALPTEDHLLKQYQES